MIYSLTYAFCEKCYIQKNCTQRLIIIIIKKIKQKSFKKICVPKYLNKYK